MAFFKKLVNKVMAVTGYARDRTNSSGPGVVPDPSSLIHLGNDAPNVSSNPPYVSDAVHPQIRCNTPSHTGDIDNSRSEYPGDDCSFQGVGQHSGSHSLTADSLIGGKGCIEETVISYVLPEVCASKNDGDTQTSDMFSTVLDVGFQNQDLGTPKMKGTLNSSCREAPKSIAQARLTRKVNDSGNHLAVSVHAPVGCDMPRNSGISDVMEETVREVARGEMTRLFPCEDTPLPVFRARQKTKRKTLPKITQSVQNVCTGISADTPTGSLYTTDKMSSIHCIPKPVQLFPYGNADIPVYPARQTQYHNAESESQPKQSMHTVHDNISKNPVQKQKPIYKSSRGSHTNEARTSDYSHKQGKGSGARPKYTGRMQLSSKEKNGRRSENMNEVQKQRRMSNPSIRLRPAEARTSQLGSYMQDGGSNVRSKHVGMTQDVRVTKIATGMTQDVRVTTIATGRSTKLFDSHNYQPTFPKKENRRINNNARSPGHYPYLSGTRSEVNIAPVVPRTNRRNRSNCPAYSKTTDDACVYRLQPTLSGPNDSLANDSSDVTSVLSAFDGRNNIGDRSRTIAAEACMDAVKNNKYNGTRGRNGQAPKWETNIDTCESLVKVVSHAVIADSDLDNILVKKQKALDKHKHKMATLRDVPGEQAARLHELEAQKSEFESSTRLLLDGLRDDEDDARANDTMTQLRRRFGVEVKRLETALPIYARRTDIVETVRDNAVCVILGETGSGKSTQLTQYVFEAGAAPGGKIVCTQPRKVAAISLATRVAQELATPIGGDIVGYRVGLQRRQSNKTALLYVTDHVLLNECLQDPELKAYSCIIIDEAHERSIYTDLLIGMVKRCLTFRKDLRVIITSATIDPKLFVRYFGGCPVLQVQGRTFPVSVQYASNCDRPGKGDYLERAVRKVKEIHSTEPIGDVLVFVPTALDTEKGCKETSRLGNVVALSLHGGLPPNEQQKVFDPDIDGRRKIVFATNCAETSVTVPGIKYVIDTGLAKERTYDPQLNVSSLQMSVISRSSADQRKGRAGRTAPGTCYRLYSSDCYETMMPSSIPEILRIHLGQAMLKLMDIGVDNAASFDYVESPEPAAMEAAALELESLGATTDGRINNLGRQLSRLNVQPRLGKVIILAIESGVGYEGVLMTALSTVGGYVFFRGVGDNEQQLADKNKFRLCDESGDGLTFVSLYKEWSALPDRAKNTWCVENSVNAKFMRLARDSVSEIKRTLKQDIGIEVTREQKQENVIDRLLMEILLECYPDNLGYFSGHRRIGYWVANGSGVGASGRTLHLHPSSALASLGVQPRWIIFENTMVTTRPFVTNVTAIDDDLVQRFVADGKLQGVDSAALSRQQLVACPLTPVGRSVMGALTGHGFEHLKCLEKDMRVRYTTDTLILEASFSDSRLVVYVTQELADTVTAVLYEIIANEKSRLADEFSEVELGSGGGSNGGVGIRVVLGRGGAVTHLLMPDEYRTIVVTDVANGVDVMDALHRIGPVVKYFRFKAEDRSNRWGKVTFAQPDDARRAVSDNEGLFSARIVGGFARSGAYSAFTIKTKWCRRQTKGFAFVTLRKPEDVSRICGSAVWIRGRCVEVNVSRQDSMQLFLKNLPSDADEADISTALKLKVDDDDLSIVKVVIPRKIVGATTPEELDRLKTLLSAQIKTYHQTKDYRVEMFPPREKDFYYNGRICFATITEGMTALHDLNDHIFINSERVTFKPDFRTSLTVAKPVFDVIREELEEVMTTCNRGGTFVNVPTNRGLDRDDVAICIHADDLPGLQTAAYAIRRVIQSTAVEFESTEEFRCLTGRNGLERLRRIEGSTGVKITVDRRLMKAFVHGSKEAYRRAAIEIDRFIQDNKTLLRKEVMLRDFSGDEKTVRLMKLLFTKYGVDLAELQRLTGAVYLELQLRHHALVFRGAQGAYDSLLKTLHENEAQSRDGPTATPSTHSPDCPVCFCPIDDGDVYRLEYCGHAYCRPCIVALLEHNSRDADFPVKCVHEDCGEPVVLRDLTKLLGHSTEVLTRWHRAAVESLVKANRELYRYCITPDCPTVYRAATAGHRSVCLRCSECSVVLCTACNVQYHDGVTCAEYQAMKRDDNFDIKSWLSDNSANRALCPSCATPIEKSGGCDHMQCTVCHAHICWKCKAVFQNADATYDHMVQRHGGIFDIQ